MTTVTLQVQLESELPPEVAVGAGTALFVCGWCFCPVSRIRSLSFLVDGEPQPVAAWAMPRLDPFRALHPGLDPFATAALSTDPSSAADPLLLSYRSGFWGTVRIAGGDDRGGECRLSLLAELEAGGEAVAELARIPRRAPIEPVAAPWPADASGPRVAIAMATYEPPLDLLERQLDSIRAQNHRNWICIVSDDCSSPERCAAMIEAIGDDPRFVLSRSPRRKGFYHNFERALELVPVDARYVAMADQDDIWHPDKLDVLLAEIGGAQLVYSDARVVLGDGELISETWWSARRNNHSDLLSLLVANAVTGAASLFPRELLALALPFPPAQFAHFHDHWIGLTALALGEITFVQRPLYDYVQHGDASLGHAAANQMTSLGDRLRRQRAPAERVRMWRLHYFVDVCRLTQFATVLKLRCDKRLTPAKRRTLDRFLETDRSVLPMISLGLRGARELLGRPETLGAEWMLFSAFVWRRLLKLSVRERPRTRLRLDALPPPSLVLAPGRAGLPESASVVADKIAPLPWAVSDDAPPRVNLLIPTIDLQHFFGGYIAKFNLARRLAERGARVRIVTVDPIGQLPSDWVAQLESFSGLGKLFDSVEIALGCEASAIEVSRADSFIATTWWTAHIARQAAQSLGGERFLYLIQEYEPFTFPMGSYAALADQSYRFPHFALFSSELLRDYFRAHELGVFAAGALSGDRHSAAFENAITEVAPPTVEDLAGRRTRRLLFYARPEPHAARNMFELGLLALSRALERGGFRSGWELHGIGTVQRGTRISLGGGATLDLLPRSDQRSYASLLREHDVGLALMYTPHPSLVPIEMASGGMLTVTNSFENKTPQAMAAISTNLITAEPSVEGVAAGLLEAAAGAAGATRRVRGSDVRWSRDWDQSFDDELLEQLANALGHAGAAGR